MRGEPFVAGVSGERGGLEKNFAGQKFLEPAQQHFNFRNHFKRNGAGLIARRRDKSV